MKKKKITHCPKCKKPIEEIILSYTGKITWKSRYNIKIDSYLEENIEYLKPFGKTITKCICGKRLKAESLKWRNY
ncbi:hypothetical protein ACFL5C_03255 [Candidatus Omnitrophota bacterium]